MFQENLSFRLVETDFRATNGFLKKKRKKKRILFPLNKNSDSTSQNEGFVKLRQKTTFTGRNIYIKMHRKWFPILGERLLYKKWLHLNLNSGFH